MYVSGGEYSTPAVSHVARTNRKDVESAVMDVIWIQMTFARGTSSGWMVDVLD